MGTSDEDEDPLDTFVERTAYLRQLQKAAAIADADADETTRRWKKGKQAAMVAFPLGLLAGCLASFIPPRTSLSEFWVFVFWDGVIAASIAFILAHQWHADRTQSAIWLRPALIAVAVGWLVLFTALRWSYFSTLDPFGLMIVGWVSLFCISMSVMLLIVVATVLNRLK